MGAAEALAGTGDSEAASKLVASDEVQVAQALAGSGHSKSETTFGATLMLEMPAFPAQMTRVLSYHRASLRMVDRPHST